MCRVTRRELLQYSALSLGTMAAGGTLFAGAASAAATTRRIDVHHHILPPPFIDEVEGLLREIIPYGVDLSPLLNWRPEDSLEEMDRNGIEKAYVSLAGPGAWHGDVEQARRLMRVTNEYAADMASRFSGRYGVFATLVPPDLDGSLAELEYAFDELGVDGIGLFSSYDGNRLGAAEYRPLFEELNRRNAVVYVHPITPMCCNNVLPEIADTYLEFPFDTTRTITSLLYSGTFSRFPDIQFIFSHGGGAMPMLIHRIAASYRSNPDFRERLPNGVDYEIKRQYYDTASVSNAGAMAALTSLVGTSQVLFGSDFPFVPAAVTINGLSGCGLTADEIKAIDYGNAERVFAPSRRQPQG